MVKVLILNDVLTKGGKERRIVELLKYSKQHFDIKFEIIFMHDGVDFPEIYTTKYPIHIIKWSNKKFWEGYKKILLITNNFQPDVIHSWASMTDMIAILLKLHTKKKFVSSMIAEALPFRSYKNKDYLRSKISFRFADVITSNTKAGLLSFKAPVTKSICIYNGFNFDRLTNLKDPEILKTELSLKNKFVIGMVAAFAPRKDYETFINSAKSLLTKYPGKFYFLLIGTGPLLKNMMSLAGEYANRDIFFTGLLNDVEEYINICDVGVLCTNTNIHGEGISNSIMEYMALCKPVIATVGGGTAEIVTNAENGYLIPLHDSSCLEEKILYFKNNPVIAKEFGLAGQKRIKSQFTIEAMCNTFYDIYNN